MSGTTATTIILVVAFLCLTLCYIAWLLVSRCGGRRGGFQGYVTLLVPARTGDNQTIWEPFVVAPEPHEHEHTHDHPHNHDGEVAGALAAHVDEFHGPHGHDDLATRQELQNVRQQLADQADAIRRFRRSNWLLRVRVASQYPFEVIGAIVGAIVGVIIAFSIPSRLYSYPTVTRVTVNGSVAKVQHQLAQNHWVLGGIIVAGLLVGLVIGLALKYVFGRTDAALEEVQR